MEFLNATVNQLSNFFVQLSGESGWFLFVVIFGAVFALVVAIGFMLAGRNPVERRLAADAGTDLINQSSEEFRLRSEKRESPWNKLVENLEKHFTPKEDSTKSAMRLKMIQAGFFSENAVKYYFVIRILATVGLPLAYLLWISFVPGNVDVQLHLYFAVIAAAIGYVAPRAILDRKLQMRQLAVQEGFPDSLDMMVVCVEAGLGLDAAFNRVGTQMAPAYPILAQHFGMVSLELRAGKSREEALRGFSERIGLPEINSFVILMIQSDQLGTSIAQTLRVHSDEMRIKRMLRAEEKAHRLPVMLAIPLVVGILPCMMTVALLPSIIRVMRVLLPALGGELS